MSNHKIYYCSFCGKSTDDVPKMISGPDNVFICNECVSLCWDIVNPMYDGNREYDSWHTAAHGSEEK